MKLELNLFRKLKDIFCGLFVLLVLMLLCDQDADIFEEILPLVAGPAGYC